MQTESKLYQEFEQYMRNKDEKSDITVGKKDKGGNLLILGGAHANLWQLASGLFDVASEKFADDEEAVKCYNQYNSSELRLDYIRTVFMPWYEKQFKVVTEVPSATSDKKYTVRRDPNGNLTCECMGFRFRRACWHIDAIKELEKEI